MAYRLPPLGSLRAFEAAARHLSFKHAAEELHVTPAAISQQIKGLEDYLGVRLLVRLTRALAITPQGEAMLPKIRAGFDCLAEAVGSTCSAEAAAGGCHRAHFWQARSRVSCTRSSASAASPASARA